MDYSRFMLVACMAGLVSAVSPKTNSTDAFHIGDLRGDRPDACGATHTCSCKSTRRSPFTVDCRGRHLHQVPKGFPPNTTTIILMENEITELPEGMLWVTPVLETLLLSFNNVTVIPPDTFSKSTMLKRLNLENNKIAALSPELFANNPKLELLVLSANNLTSLPDGLIHNLTRLKNVILQNNRIRHLHPDFFADLPNLTTVDMTNNQLQEISARQFISTPKLEELNLVNNEITYLHPDVFSKSPKLTRIDMTGNHLGEISARHFASTTNLKNMLFSRNDLRQLPEDLLKHTPNLTEFQFARNSLDHFPARLFETTTDITFLALSWNNIPEVPKEAFTSISKLQYMRIFRNKIRSIHPETFFLNPVAYSIDISNNELTSIPGNLFSRNPRICNIDISYNSLTSLPIDLVKNLTKLERLHLAGNQLSEIPVGFFNSINNLTYLSLSGNKLHTISKSMFQGLQSVAYLDFAWNNISVLPKDLFSNLSIAAAVDFSNNAISEIPGGFFNYTKQPAVLIVFQRNQITHLKRESFVGLTQVKYIFLNYNNISSIGEATFADVGRISTTFLYGNNMSTLTNNSFGKQNTGEMHIYGNRITNLSEKALGGLNDSMRLLLSCDDLEGLPFTPQRVNSTCVKSRFAPQLSFDTMPTTIRDILTKDGFICRVTRHNAVCSPCAPGSFGDAGGSCISCPRGGYYQDEIGSLQCKVCDNGSYVSESGASSVSQCKVCPGGTDLMIHAGYRACFCRDDYTRTDRYGGCTKCRNPGLDCSQDYEALRPGYYWSWSFPGTSLLDYRNFVINLRTVNTSFNYSSTDYEQRMPSIFRCAQNFSCANNNSSLPEAIEGTCAEGYRGWLCSKCEDSYYSVLSSCVACPSVWWVVLEMVVIVCVFIALSVFFLMPRKHTGINTSEKARTALDKLSSRIKITLGFYQVIGEVSESFHSVDWSGPLVYIGQMLTVLEFHFFKVFIHPSCLSEKLALDPLLEFKIASAFPVGVIMTTACVYLAYYVYKRVRRSSEGDAFSERINTMKDRMCTYALLILFITYPPTCGIIFQLFPMACDTFTVVDGLNNTINLLRADYDIECSQLATYHTAAYVATLCYIAAFPSTLLYLLWRYHRQETRYNPVSADAQHGSIFDDNDDSGHQMTGDGQCVAQVPHGGINSDNDGSDHLAHSDVHQVDHVPPWLTFLCENYKPRFWYWEVVELARKIMQTMMITLLGWEDSLTRLITIGSSVFFLTLHVKFSPMKSNTEQRLQLFSLAAIFINVLVAAVPIAPRYQTVLTIMLVTLDSTIAVVIVGEALLVAVRFARRYVFKNRSNVKAPRYSPLHYPRRGSE